MVNRILTATLYVIIYVQDAACGLVWHPLAVTPTEQAAHLYIETVEERFPVQQLTYIELPYYD